MKLIIEWNLPIKTVSEANSCEHWSKKNTRHRSQKGHVRVKFLAERPKIELPVHVKLTRISPRFLDKLENLPCSMKYIVDEVAANLTGDFRPGRADSDTRITWECAQEKGNPQSVKIGFYKHEA